MNLWIDIPMYLITFAALVWAGLPVFHALNEIDGKPPTDRMCAMALLAPMLLAAIWPISAPLVGFYALSYGIIKAMKWFRQRKS